jgi:hypothetical protein
MSKPDAFTPEELRQRVAALTPEERHEAARQEAERVKFERLEAERVEVARLAAAHRAEEDRAAAYAAQIASATATLHTQAMGILNIKPLVTVVLDIGSSNYNRWRGLVLNTLERYALADHVLDDADLSDDVPWRHLDCTVLSWLYGTISPELHEVVSNCADRPPTARLVWLGLERQFLGNRETRAMTLDTEFRTIVQGDLSITEYCRRLKMIADQLADLGEPVRDRTLVLNVLRGLNERFTHLADHIQRQHPFPDYNDLLADLQLAEMNMKTKQAASPQAFAASTSCQPAAAPLAPASGSSGTPTGSASGNSGNRRRQGNRRNNNGGPPSSSTGPPIRPGFWPAAPSPRGPPASIPLLGPSRCGPASISDTPPPLAGPRRPSRPTTPACPTPRLTRPTRRWLLCRPTRLSPPYRACPVHRPARLLYRPHRGSMAHLHRLVGPPSRVVCRGTRVFWRQISTL